MHITAGAAIGRTLQDGLEAVRRLKILVPIRLRGNTDLLGAWERASQIDYPSWPSRRPKPEPEPAAEPGATA